jgi:hypothetical protein
MFEPIGKVSRRKYIYFERGAGYSTSSGVRFSKENPVQKVSDDEYDMLITNSNFRQPTDQEIIKHLGE